MGAVEVNTPVTACCIPPCMFLHSQPRQMTKFLLCHRKRQSCQAVSRAIIYSIVHNTLITLVHMPVRLRLSRFRNSSYPGFQHAHDSKCPSNNGLFTCIVKKWIESLDGTYMNCQRFASLFFSEETYHDGSNVVVPSPCLCTIRHRDR